MRVSNWRDNREKPYSKRREDLGVPLKDLQIQYRFVFIEEYPT